MPLPERGWGRAFRCLLGKEWRELLAARSWWLMLFLIGPLVGFSFISAVRTYGELSGLNGTAAGVGEAFSPLIGIWAPTFSACELAAAFLLPFVVIRLVAGDRQSGALMLELQQPVPAVMRVVAKLAVALAGWFVASIAPLLAILIWRAYGGSVYLPEVGAVWAGHTLNAALAIALAAAAAAVTEHPSTAAIVTLAATVGGWLVNFAAAIQGGIWERLRAYTPTSMVAEFQHGLVRLENVLAVVVLAALGLGVTATWLRIGRTSRRRALESAVLASVALVLLAAGAHARPSWDASEARLNSFPASDERRLASIAAPVRMEVQLAPEDPRRMDLERNTVSKLRRTLDDFEIRYVSTTTTALFEQTREHYGEVRIDVGHRSSVTRATTTDGVLEQLYLLAEIGEGSDDEDEVFRGHPLAVAPTGAAAVFYLGWPAAVAGMVLMGRGRGS